MRRRWLIPAVLAAGFGLTGAGQAQTVPELRLDRQDDGNAYEPLGIEAGGLTLFSSLGVSGTVSSNVTRQSSGDDFGVGATLRPSLNFQSDWVRHSWSGEASAELVRFLDHPEMATSSADASSNLTIDIRRTTTAEFSVGYSLDVDANRDSGVIGSEIGDGTVHTFNGSGGLTHDWGPMATRITASLERGLYEDVKLSGGGTQDNGDRDYWEPKITLRATYTDPPVFKPFVEASYGKRLYDRNLDRNGQERDADDTELRAGVAISDDPIWSGELAATYLYRAFNDPALSDIDAFGVSGSLTWSPTELTQVTVDLGTALTDSQDRDDPGGQSWSGALAFTQALRDNLDLLAGAGLTLEDTISGDDVTYEASLGLEWKLNRNLALTAGYDFTLEDSSDAADDYTEHRVSAGVVLRR